MRNIIGKIIGIYTNKIIIELKESTFFPFNHDGFSYSLTGIGDYLIVEVDNSLKTLYSVISMYQKEKPLSRDKDAKFSDITIAEATPVGEWRNGKFQFGITKYPMVGKNVYIAVVKEIKNVFSNETFNYVIDFGELINLNNIQVSFSIPALFSNHMAILGNSGSGKSTTIRKLISSVLFKIDKDKDTDLKKMNLIVFDIHDEYGLFQKQNATNINVLKEIAIPLEYLKIDDWINLILPSIAVQLPMLKQALKFGNILENKPELESNLIAFIIQEIYSFNTEPLTRRTKIISLSKMIKNNKELKEILKNYNSKYANMEPQDESNFKSEIIKIIGENNFDMILSEAEDKIKNISSLKKGMEFAFLWEECKGNNQIRSNCMTMMTRIDVLISDYGKNIFSTDQNKINNFNKLINFSTPLLIANVSDLGDEELNFFASFYLGQLYKQQKKNKSQQNKPKLYNLIFDEAHRYIKEEKEKDFVKPLNMFERIAKEGRKFGIFIILSSQRPGEISKTVLSQCNNYILHRIRSNIDLEQIKKSNPFIDENQINRLPILPTGAALMMGEAFNAPVEIKIIASEEDKKHSETSNPIEMWKKKN